MGPLEVKFYKKFWNDNACKDIFLSHRSRLLKARTLDLGIIRQDYFSSEIIICNSFSGEEDIKKVQNRVESIAIDIEHNLELSIQKYFDEEQIWKFLNKKYGRTIQKAKKKVEKKGVFNFIFKVIESFQSEKEILKLAHKYHLTPSRMSSIKELENHFLEDLKRETHKFLQKENISELFFSIDDISKIYDSKLRDIILKSGKHYTEVFYKHKGDLVFENRIKLFEELFELGILKFGKSKSYYECTNCTPNTFSGLFNTNIPPEKLNLNCPACGEKTFFAVPFEICKEIYEHIKHQDGILFHAIHYLLYDFSIPHDIDVVIPKDIQIDMCILDKNDRTLITEIIEVKMFKRDRPKDTKIENLKQAFKQIERMRKKLAEHHPNTDYIKYSIVSNIEDIDIINEAKQKIGEDFKAMKVEIYTPESYRDYLKSI